MRTKKNFKKCLPLLQLTLFSLQTSFLPVLVREEMSNKDNKLKRFLKR